VAAASEAPEPAREPDRNDVEEERLPHFDEDTFRAWQHAQEKAESSAMEKEAKASSACCAALFQLMIVCLIVGKLQRDYEQPDPSGYNAFWVLFPIFLVVGLIFCLCACLIYGPAYESESAPNRAGDVPGSEDIEMGRTGGDEQETTEPEPPIIVAPAAPPQRSDSEMATTPAAESVEDGSPQGSDDNDAAPSDEGESNRAPSDEAVDINDLD
jgi:hypothetical protein